MTVQRNRDRLERPYHFLLVFSLLFCIFSSANADEVLTTDGSRLIGELVRHDAQVLKLKTSFAGTLEIKWDQVKQVTMSSPGTVLLDDDQLIEIRSLSREGDQFVFYPVTSETPLHIESSQVKAFKPEPWELGLGHKFTGRVNLGIENEEGNSESREYDLDMELNNRWRKNQLKIIGQLEYDTTRGLKSTDNWTVFANLDHTFSGAWNYAAALLLRQDYFKDLQLRSGIGPTLGYRFFDSPKLKLRTDLGIYYLKDDFYEQVDESFWGPGWYLEYEQMVWKNRMQLYHRHFTFVAANESGKSIWRSWSGLRFPIYAGFTASAEYEIDYDSEPTVEVENTDSIFKIKLGYEWK